MNKISISKILLSSFIILIIFGYSSVATEPAIEIHPEHAPYYQQRPCTYSIFEMLKQDLNKYDIEILIDTSGEIECFGKNSWFEYQIPKLIENGWDKFEPEKITIWISTNIHVDLLFQTFLWLLILSLIPNGKKTKFTYPLLISLINTLIFYIHLVGESSFYKSISRVYDPTFISREFNGSLYYQNYFLYLYCLLFFLISRLLIKIIENKFENLINYIPFIFLVFGTYSSLNLNFYSILLSLIGINSLISSKINKKITFIYFFFAVVWILNLDNEMLNFDVDKTRGFINSSQSYLSLFYWVIIYYLIVAGIIFLIKKSKYNYQFKIFRRNLLLSSSLIFILGNVAAINKLFNFLSYYFLGLNKFGMRSLESIDGNTWRGIAPSAEGMGEFFAFSLLFSIIFSHKNKEKLIFLDFFTIPITLFGLIRTNNFAATISMLLLLLVYFLYIKINSKKLIVLLLGLIILITGTVYSFVYREFSYTYLSSNILYEGVQASQISSGLKLNELGQTEAEKANYQYLLELPEDSTNFSTSLRFLIENYTYGYNIKYVPSYISLINLSSYLVNRSEKWGIFFAKYNPSVSDFLFGYGPQQFTNYYFGHPTDYNFGLYLPHSSVLSYLLFFGFLGIMFICYIIFITLKNSDYEFTGFYLIIFFFLNFLKSDSLLYLPNLILFLAILFIFNKSNFKIES